MACTTHIFGISVQRHDWHRGFVGTDTDVTTEFDMWGRAIRNEHVVCHTRPICKVCGAVGEPVECICDKSKADSCAFRLEGMNAPGGGAV